MLASQPRKTGKAAECLKYESPPCSLLVTQCLRYAKGTVDDVVMAHALGGRRILITEHPDFGEFVYARGHSSVGVRFVRFPNRVRRAKPTYVVEAVAKLSVRLSDSFTVCDTRLPLIRHN